MEVLIVAISAAEVACFDVGVVGGDARNLSQQFYHKALQDVKEHLLK
jgi:hypothetical protein